VLKRRSIRPEHSAKIFETLSEVPLRRSADGGRSSRGDSVRNQVAANLDVNFPM
jgi:hypothetical protein